MLRIIPFAHLTLKEFIRKDACVIDMTCGNGFDTKFLASLPVKKIYAFDIQKQALEQAKKLVQDDRIAWILDSHINVAKHVEEFDAAIFNLGYLPGADHLITTTGPTTIEAIKQLTLIARKPALIVIVVYPGHLEGQLESKQVLAYLKTLGDDFLISKYEMLQNEEAPYVLSIQIKNKWSC